MFHTADHRLSVFGWLLLVVFFIGLCAAGRLVIRADNRQRARRAEALRSLPVEYRQLNKRPWWDIPLLVVGAAATLLLMLFVSKFLGAVVGVSLGAFGANQRRVAAKRAAARLREQAPSMQSSEVLQIRDALQVVYGKDSGVAGDPAIGGALLQSHGPANGPATEGSSEAKPGSGGGDE